MIFHNSVPFTQIVLLASNVHLPPVQILFLTQTLLNHLLIHSFSNFLLKTYYMLGAGENKTMPLPHGADGWIWIGHPSLTSELTSAINKYLRALTKYSF